MPGPGVETQNTGPWSQFQNMQPTQAPTAGPWTRFAQDSAAQPRQQNDPGFGQQVGGLATNLVYGLPFVGPYLDEAAGAAVDLFGGDGESTTNAMRKMQSEYETAYPKSAMAAKLVGGVTGSAAALAAAPVGLATGLAARLGSLAWRWRIPASSAFLGALGAAEGGIAGYGAGGEEGGPTREESAASGAMGGLAAGAILGPAGQVIAPAGRVFYKGLRNISGGKNQTDVATDIVNKTILRSGQTAREVIGEARKHPVGGLIGAEPVPSLASVVASTTAQDSRAAQMMAEAQRGFIAGGRERMGAQLGAALDTPRGISPGKMAFDLESTARDEFKKGLEGLGDIPLTDEARALFLAAKDVNLTSGAERVAKAESSLGREASSGQFPPEFPINAASSRFGDVGGVTTPPESVVDLLSEAARRQAAGIPSVNESQFIAGTLKPGLEELSPGLGKLRQNYKEGMAASEAAPRGAASVSGTADPFTVRSRYKDLNPAGQMAFRKGAAGELENLSLSTNPGQKLDDLLDKGNLGEIMGTVGRGDSVKTLKDYARREARGLSNLQAATPSRVGGGLGKQDVGDSAGRFAYMTPGGAAIAFIVDMTSKLSDRVFNGLTAEGRRELARITTSTNPAEVAAILQNRVSALDREKVIDAMRSAGIAVTGVLAARE